MKIQFLIILNLALVLNTGFVEDPGLTSVNPSHRQDDVIRKNVAEKILKNLVQEKFEDVRADFHSTLKQSLPAERISEAWVKQLETYGEYKSTVSMTSAKFQEYNQVKIRCKFENDNSTIEVTFNEDNKVIGLYLKA